MPTVEDVLGLAAGALGDSTQRRFTNPELLPHFKLAYGDMKQEMVLHGAKDAKHVVYYTLPANTLTLTPATALIVNFGVLSMLRERRAGSSDAFTEVIPVGKIGTAPPGISLGEFEERKEGWFFHGATIDIQLEITYFTNGTPPDSGEIGIPDAELYLAPLTAIKAGPTKGLTELARHIRADFYDKEGPRDKFISLIVQSQMHRRTQQPRYDASEGVARPRGRGGAPLFG